MEIIIIIIITNMVKYLIIWQKLILLLSKIKRIKMMKINISMDLEIFIV